MNRELIQKDYIDMERKYKNLCSPLRIGVYNQKHGIQGILCSSVYLGEVTAAEKPEFLLILELDIFMAETYN